MYEYELSRIINSYVYVHDRNLKIYYPTIDIEYRSQIIKREILSCFDLIDSEVFLFKSNSWSTSMQVELDKCEEEIENLKAQYFTSFFNHSQAGQLRSELKQAKQKYSELLSRRAYLDHYSNSGVGEYASLAFFIEHSTFTVDDKPFDWSNWSVKNAILYWKQNELSEEIIRKIARSDEWTIMWNTSKSSHTPLFSSPTTELNQDQRRLIFWTNLYSSLSNLEEPLDDRIVNDDDAFDGFLIKRAREKRREKAKNAFESSLTDKQRNAQELYVVADKNNLKESLENIYSQNNKYANLVVEARKNALSKLKQGESIKHHDFQDVKQNLLIQKNKAMRMKNGT